MNNENKRPSSGASKNPGRTQNDPNNAMQRKDGQDVPVDSGKGAGKAGQKDDPKRSSKHGDKKADQQRSGGG
ncbi:hypothetical protein ACQQ2N_17305 [Dokdonella sp. MW10]|uniref:hypothetical protein n=1 Tax=Dokdonella sp. MW10 TaxID=2992926 RepID=UPI003F7FB348